MDREERVDEYLKHYGVLGMKWGKRKARISKTSQPQQKKRRMSNKELTARVKRLRLEKEFRELTAKPKTPSKIEQAVKAAGTVAALTGSAYTIYKNIDGIMKLANTAKKASGK